MVTIKHERELTYSDSKHGYALSPGVVRRNSRVAPRVAYAVSDDDHKRRGCVADAEEQATLIDPGRGVRAPPGLDVAVDQERR